MYDSYFYVSKKKEDFLLFFPPQTFDGIHLFPHLDRCHLESQAPKSTRTKNATHDRKASKQVTHAVAVGPRNAIRTMSQRRSSSTLESVAHMASGPLTLASPGDDLMDSADSEHARPVVSQRPLTRSLSKLSSSTHLKVSSVQIW